MSATFRHALRSRKGGDVLVKVYPHDGRQHEDRYFVHATELRRFAWAVLADLDPDGAAQAALEEGQDLEDLCALDFPLPRAGTMKRRILEALRDGPRTTGDVADVLPASAPVRALLSELVRKDFVRRHLEGPHTEVRWTLTARAERGLISRSAA